MNNKVTNIKALLNAKMLNILTLLFVIFKLTNVINWSWFWCFLPMIYFITYRIVQFVIFAIAMMHFKKKYGLEFKKTEENPEKRK